MILSRSTIFSSYYDSFSLCGISRGVVFWGKIGGKQIYNKVISPVGILNGNRKSAQTQLKKSLKCWLHWRQKNNIMMT